MKYKVHEKILKSFKKHFLQSFNPHDDSGPIVLYMTEQAIVTFADVVDAVEFEQFHL